MRTGVIAEKIGMTQVFTETGNRIPVTVLKVPSCTVIAQRTKEADGYDAVQLGAFPVATSKLTKPLQGFFAKLGATPCRVLKEFRVDAEGHLEIGSMIGASHFSVGQKVDVAGVSIGKGFAGAMKRHHFGGLRATHGVSVSHRSHGSIGNREDPGKVFKNKRMAGHMGARHVTVLNLLVQKIDAERGLVFVKGSIPGGDKSIVYVRDTVKNAAH